MGEDSPKTASLWQALKMVLSAFIGIRKHDKQGTQGEQNIRVTPLQLVIIGIIAAAAFVFTVKTIVSLVLR